MLRLFLTFSNEIEIVVLFVLFLKVKILVLFRSKTLELDTTLLKSLESVTYFCL